MLKRRRFKQSISFKERLTEWAKTVRDHANKLPPGAEREDLLQKARQADTAAHLADWTSSPGLQPPT